MVYWIIHSLIHRTALFGTDIAYGGLKLEFSVNVSYFIQFDQGGVYYAKNSLYET